MALLCEGGDALAGIGGGGGPRHRLRFGLHLRLGGYFARHAQETADFPDRAGGAGGDLAGQRIGPRSERLGALQHFVDQPCMLSSRCVPRLVEDQEAARLGTSDPVDERKRHAPVASEPDAGISRDEPRPIARQNEVGACHKRHHSPGTDPVDRHDDRRIQSLQSKDSGMEIAGPLLHQPRQAVQPGQETGDVAAVAEGPAFRADQHGTNVVALRQVDRHFVEVAAERAVDGVAGIGLRERQPGDAVAHIEAHRLVGHASTLPSGASLSSKASRSGTRSTGRRSIPEITPRSSSSKAARAGSPM